MRPDHRYTLLMLGLSPIDLAFTGCYVVLAARPAALADALICNLAILVVLNGLGAWWLARPLARALARPGDPAVRAAAARRLARLPSLSVAWTVGVGLVYCLAAFHYRVFLPDAATLADLSDRLRLGAVGWFALAYVLQFVFYVYFAASDATASARRDLFGRIGLIVPARGRGLRGKIVFALIMLTCVPAAAVLLDVGVFEPIRRAQGLSVTGAVVLDVVGTLIAAGITAIFLTRALTRPVESLGAAVGAVQAGRLDIATPVLADDEIGRLAGSFNTMIEGLRERERVRETFGKYVSPTIVSRVLAAGRAEGGRMAGEAGEATVLFSDITGFTARVERLSADEAIALINDYFVQAVAPVEAAGGWVTDFIGDGMHAVFNLPDADRDHALNGVRAAVALAALTAGQRFAAGAQGGILLPTRIGLHCGPVTAGTVGSDARLKYTVYGDTVNLAQRLEALNKNLGTTVLMSEAVVRRAGLLDTGGRPDPAAPWPLVDLGPQAIRGRQQSVRVFTVRAA